MHGPNRCPGCGQFAGVTHECPHALGSGESEVLARVLSRDLAPMRVPEQAVRAGGERSRPGADVDRARVAAGLAALRYRRTGDRAHLQQALTGAHAADTGVGQQQPTGVPAGQEVSARCDRCGQFVEPGHNCSPVPKPMPASDYAEMKGEERTKAMLSDLREAVGAVVASGQLRRWLDAMASNGLHRWSLNNRMLALMQLAERGEDLDGAHLAGFRQWQDLNRRVRKGEKAIWILAPTKRKLVEESEDGQKNERVIVTGFRAVPVFNISQTDGEALPPPPIAVAEGEATAGTLEGLRARVGTAGYSYREQEIPGCDPSLGTGTLGYTSPSGKEIVVDSRLSGAQKAAVIAHELGHVHCGHVDGAPGEYQRHRGRMETEAEMTAYLVTRGRGMSRGDADAFSSGYIASWSKGDDGMVVAAMDRSTKAFNTIMEGHWD